MHHNCKIGTLRTAGWFCTIDFGGGRGGSTSCVGKIPKNISTPTKGVVGKYTTELRGQLLVHYKIDSECTEGLSFLPSQ